MIDYKTIAESNNFIVLDKSWPTAVVTGGECYGCAGTGGFLSEGDEYIQQIS